MTNYKHPRGGNDKQMSANIALPADFTHAAFYEGIKALLEKGYRPHDFFDQANLDAHDPALLMNFVMQYSPEATYDLLKILNDLRQETPDLPRFPLCVTVRMDSESFDIKDEWVKDVFDKIQGLERLDISYAIQISPDISDINTALKTAAHKFGMAVGDSPKGFVVVPLAGVYLESKTIADCHEMSNITSDQFKGPQDMWSDSNGGWYGSLRDKVTGLKAALPILIQNSEGAWWSPKPMHAYDRLKRIGGVFQGIFPEDYVRMVQKGKRFIPGETGSIIAPSLGKKPHPVKRP